MNFYQAKVSYERQTDNAISKVNETYLVSADSFTEAETKIVKELRPLAITTNEVIDVKSLTFLNIKDFIRNEESYADPIYAKVKVAFQEVDMKSGTVKSKPCTLIVVVEDLKEVFAIIEETFKGSNLQILSVTDMLVLDMF